MTLSRWYKSGLHGLSVHGKTEAYVVGDNDSTGIEYREKVCQLLHGKVGALYALFVPSAHNDISDWKDAGGTAEDFKTLLNDAQPWHSPTSKQETEFCFTSIGEMLTEPEVETDWLVEQLLPVGGLSVIGGKPKAGKSTTVRNLCLAVARGEPFLGRTTEQGPVLYCAFEEKRGEVTKHFRQLGAVVEDAIFCFVGRAPEDFLAKLHPVLQKTKPLLIILDTLVKVAHVKDMNDYSQVMKALDPFLHMARESGAHLLLVHHAGKSDREGGDNLLGSTGIFASVDTCFIQKRSDKYRTLQSINRYGTDLEESVLEWDEDSRAISLGGTKKDSEVNRFREEIVEFLKKQEEPVRRELIEESIEGRTGLKREALKILVQAEAVTRAGKGGKGDPFTYSYSQIKKDQKEAPVKDSCSLVPTIIWEQGNKNAKNDEKPHEHKPDACSQGNGLFDQEGDSREQAFSDPESPAEHIQQDLLDPKKEGADIDF